MKILLVVADSLRADAIFAPPTMRAMVDGGLCFERAVCSGSWTIPSLAAMVGGDWPHRLGLCHWRHRPPAGAPNLFQAFRDAGFFVGGAFPNPAWAFKGWPGAPAWVDSNSPAAVRALLESVQGDALFVIHHWGTHFPYIAAERPWGVHQRGAAAAMEGFCAEPGLGPTFARRYDRAVMRVSEEHLAGWIEQLCSGGDDVLVALTGDHGEHWGSALPAGRHLEHLFDLHGRWFTDETTRVPMVLWGSGRLARTPARVGDWVGGLDLAPTLCAAAGLPWAGPTGREIPAGQSLWGGDAGLCPRGFGLTIGSLNPYRPETYPARATEMWVAGSAVSEAGRCSWDPLRGPTLEGAPPVDAARLSQELAGAVDARMGEDGPPPPSLAERMAMLGYAE